MFRIDWISLFPETARGNRYVLYLIDYFDRMSFTSIVLGCSARDTVDRLAVYIAYYPTLAAIFYDPGKHYVAKETRQFCKLNSIYLAYVLSGASRLVGIVEKANNIL